MALSRDEVKIAINYRDWFVENNKLKRNFQMRCHILIILVCNFNSTEYLIGSSLLYL